MKNKIFGFLGMIVLAVVTMAADGGTSSCDGTPTADQKTQQQQEDMQAQAEKQTGLPRIVNYQELKNLNWVYELRDQANLATYSYVMDMNGNLHHVCDSVGYGIPYGTQRSNPQKVERLTSGGNYSTYTLPQAEPNGIFPPSTAEGTWLICINPDPKVDAKSTNKIGPMYVEPRVTVSLWKLHSVGEWSGNPQP